MTRREREALLGALVLLLALAAGGAVVAALAGATLVPVAALLLIAYAKGRLVVLDFLELRDSRSGLRSALLAWPGLLLSLALARSVAVALLG